MYENNITPKQQLIGRPSDGALEQEQGLEQNNAQSAETQNKFDDNRPFWLRIVWIFINAIPISLSFFAIHGDTSLTIAFLNSSAADETTVSAFSAANSFQLLVATSVIVALQQGLLVRISQAYGSGDIQLAGLYFQRGQVINTSVLILVLIPFLFGKQILLGITSDEEQAELGQNYLYIIMPSIAFAMYFFSLQSTMNACKIYFLPAICQVIGALAQAGAGYVLISRLNYGIYGAAIVLNVSWFVSLFSLILVLKYKNPVPGLFYKFSKESYRGIWDLLKFEIFCGIQHWAEFAAVQINGLVAASFPKGDNAAFAAASSNLKTFLTSASGIQVALSAEIANYMGEKRAKLGKRVLNGTIFGSVIVIGISELIITLIRSSLISSQTKDDNFDITLSLMILFQIKFPFQFLSQLYQAVSKSIGREKIGAALSIIVQVIYAIPAGFIFSKSIDLGVYGLGLSTTTSAGLSFFAYMILVYITNWEKETNDIQEALNNTVDDQGRRSLNKLTAKTDAHSGQELYQ